MKRRIPMLGVAAFAAALAITAITAAPASAATATWFDGKGCHNVLRSETGATLSQSRTGISAEGGSTGGGSQLTVWYGTYSTTQSSSVVTIDNTSTRTYQAGKFRINWGGAIDGECAGKSYGRALNANPPGSFAADASPETTLRAAEVDGWDLSATEATSREGVTVSAEIDGTTFSAVFTDEQVKNGEAEILITDHATGESHLVNYDEQRSDALSVSATERESK